MKNEILFFNNQRYLVERVVAAANSGPEITVPIEQVNTDKVSKYFRDQAMREESEASGQHDHGRVVFYKFEGQYAILMGHASIAGQTSVKGRLVSSPALKRARYEAPVSYGTISGDPPAPTGGYRRGDAVVYGGRNTREPSGYQGNSYNREDRSSGYKSSPPNERRQEPASGDRSRTRSPYRKPRDQS